MTGTVMSHTGAYRGLSPSSWLVFTQSSPMTLALWGLSVDNSSGNAKAGWKTLAGQNLLWLLYPFEVFDSVDQ